MNFDSSQPNSGSPSTPLHPTAASVDEDLARAASKSLTMGPAVVRDIWYQFAIPQKLHPDLYKTSMSDSLMEDSACSSADQQAGGKSASGGDGVPGFPDFPDFWQGESSAAVVGMRKSRLRTPTRVKHRQRQQLVRKAVNVPYGSTKTTKASPPAAGIRTGKDLKKRLRDQRRMLRIEKIVKLQERRSRKKGIGDICRGISSLKCT
jgi:hypothetical protein